MRRGSGGQLPGRGHRTRVDCHCMLEERGPGHVPGPLRHVAPPMFFTSQRFPPPADFLPRPGALTFHVISPADSNAGHFFLTEQRSHSGLLA